VARIACLEANTDEQVKWIKTKLAQRIMEYAAEGELDVVQLKEFGLQGLTPLVRPSDRAATTPFITSGRPMRSHRASLRRGHVR
jgi:hypothetical protein